MGCQPELEDYALRSRPKARGAGPPPGSANTALGAISFAALEAIGGTITLNMAVTNAHRGHSCR